MKAPSFPTGTALFHALAVTFFGGCAAWLSLEARPLTGNQRLLGLGLAVVSAGLAVLALRALVALVRARAAAPLRSRADADTYFQVLVAVGVLAVVGLRLLVTGGRPALVTFCLGTGAWLFLLGLHLVPALLLAHESLIDNLGRRTRFADLEWFTLQTAPPLGDEPPRALLRAGRGQEIRFKARLVGADAERVRQALLGAKVPARPGR